MAANGGLVRARFRQLRILGLAAVAILPVLVLGPDLKAHEPGTAFQGMDLSSSPATSDDGRFIAFQSKATNLVPGDTNAMSDIFVHDQVSGATKRVSVDSAGVESNSASWDPAISADGTIVVFDSFASNLVPGDTNGQHDVFMHNLHSGQTERISVSSAELQGNRQSAFTAISDDGRFVAFHSSSRGLVSNKASDYSDLFLRDTVAGTTERISVSSTGGDPNSSSYEYSAISSDGRYVAFASAASNLVASDTFTQDVFVRDRVAGTTTLVSIGLSAQPANAASPGTNEYREVSISDDGRYVAFASRATNLVANDFNGVNDVFVRDMLTATTSRVSVGNGGAQPNGASATPHLSANGSRVTFASDASNLTAGDVNATRDVFVHDLADATTSRASVASDGTGANRWSGYPAISGDGNHVTFASDATNLAADDTNGVRDIFVRQMVTSRTTRESVTSDLISIGGGAGEGAGDAVEPVWIHADGAPPVYDAPPCPEQWFDASSGECIHPDVVAMGAADSTEALSVEYAASRGPCAETANQDKYRVVYLFIRGEGSRYSTIKNSLVDKAKRADYYVFQSARETGGSRHIRFDCTDGGRIRIDYMRLRPQAKNGYKATVRAMRAKGEYSGTKRYVAFADFTDASTPSNPQPGDSIYCGWGAVNPDDQPGAANLNNRPGRVALVYLKPANPCWNSLSSSVLHEVGHTLGAVLQGAPDYRGGHVTDAYDVLHRGNNASPTTSACNDPALRNRFDCQDDSYFNTQGQLPARDTWLADKQEHDTGVCDQITDAQGATSVTRCHWNTAWSRWLVGGGSL